MELSEFPKEEKKGAKAGFKKTFVMRVEGKEREQKHVQLFKSQPAPCCQKRKVLDPSARRKMHLGTAPWDMLFNLWQLVIFLSDFLLFFKPCMIMIGNYLGVLGCALKC